MVGSNLYSQAIKSLWQGKCTVTVRLNETDESNGRTRPSEVDTYSNEPCRIAFNTVKATEQADNAGQKAQSITLMIDPAVDIPPGSKIIVTQNGVTGVYEQSGVPAVYSYHKEIALALFKGWV